MTNMSVRQFLATLPKNEPVYYRSNPGNAGDALIASGAYKHFKDAGINFQLVDLDDFDATGKTIFYAGGGNLVGIYPEARDFFEKYHKTAKQLILLPHTVAKNEDLLGKFGSNVTLFAREQVSYDHIVQHVTKANVYIDDDLALCLDAEAILESRQINLPEAFFQKVFYKILRSKKSLTVPQVKIMASNTKFESCNRAEKYDYVGQFFREDVESAGLEVPEGNADLSRIYEYGTVSKEITDYTTWRLMRYINEFNTVKTDRLHVCVAALLLGKEVYFHPNSYFKCRAVYEYSLKDRFEKLHWVSQ